jgi:hypothetical protein
VTKLYMDTYLFSPDLSDNQHRITISCVTVRQNHKGIPEDNKTVKHKLNQSDIQTTIKGNLTSMVWIDDYIDEYA